MSASPAQPTVTFTRLGGHTAVAADGMDLNHAPDPGLIASLRQALLDHQVLCIRGQSIGPDEFLRAISAFGRT